MNSTFKIFKTTKIFFAVLFVFLLVGVSKVDGATYTATQTGNWNVNATWGGSGYPQAGDDAIINNNYTVTLIAAAACTNLTFGGNAGVIALGTRNLSISGDLTFPCNPGVITTSGGYIVLNGTSQNINLCTGGSNSIPNLRLTNSTAVAMIPQTSLTITGSFDCTTGNSTFTNNNLADWDSGTFRITGACTAPNCTFIAGTNIHGSSLDFSSCTSNPIQVGSVTANQPDAKIDFGSKNVVSTNPFTGAYLSNINATGTVTSTTNRRFVSKANGSWSTNGTWLVQTTTNAGITWSALLDATSTPTALDLVTIQAGHTVLVNAANASASGLVIDGTLTTSSAYTLSATNITVNGTYYNGSTGAITVTNLAVNGTYNHAINGGEIPTAIWDLASNCKITGYVNKANGTGGVLTAFESSVNQNYGNFTWDCTNQNANYSLAGQLLIVNGNLTINSTGSGSISLGGLVNGDLSVGGNFVQTGGNFIVSGSGARTMTVAKNFSISGGGLFNLSSSATAANYTTVNVGGNFDFSGGTITESGSTTASVINFNGASNQIFTSGGTLSRYINFAILSGAIVDFGSSVISSGSTGGFTIRSGGKMLTANPAGITLSGATGTIQLTGYRTYSTGANYGYNGTSAQFTGLGLSQNSPGRVTVDNIAGVTFSLTTAMDNLIITSGSKVNLGTFIGHTASALYLDGLGYSADSWGGNGSAAFHRDPIYFADNTGVLTLSNTIVKIYSTTQDITIPCGVSSITVEAWGGGGAGAQRTSDGNGGGGGGGAYSKKDVPVNESQTYTVTIGGGSTSSPSPGGDSWFGSASTILAKGGSSAVLNNSPGASGGLNTSGIGTTRWSGGTGATGTGSGTTGSSGGGGSSAGTAANGSNGVANTNIGATAPSGGGNGGNGASGSTGSGVAGFTPGGGGGGGYRYISGVAPGGKGGDGQVKITYIGSPTSITLVSNPSVCQGATSANIPYSATSNCPSLYSIIYDANAIASGFTNVSLDVLPASTITLVVPAAAAVGTYNGSLTVESSSAGSKSADYAITVTVTANNWTGTSGTAWENIGNWCGGVPTISTDVIIPNVANQPLINPNITALCNNITISSGATVTIAAGTSSVIPGGFLTIGKKVTNNAGTSGIVVKSSSLGSNGSLIFIQPLLNSSVQATVEMYSIASCLGPKTDYKWEYFGVPISSVVANPTFYGSYIRRWDETLPEATHWVELNNASILTPFTGYEITQELEKTVVFQGELVNNDKTFIMSRTTLPKYQGQHIYANPYTAAIKINQLDFISGVDAVVYLYNTGSYAQWGLYLGAVSNGNQTVGQYNSIPIAYADGSSFDFPSQIPSMQAFLVLANTDGAQFRIPYSAVEKNTVSQRVPASNNSSSKVCTRIDVKGAHYSDRMWIFSSPDCTRGYDNGWDGRKMIGSAFAPQLYAIEADGNYQVNSVPDMNNTEIAFQVGEEKEDTLTFMHQNIDKRYAGVYLVDLVENKIVDITISGSIYIFSAAPTPEPVKRFKIVTRSLNQDASDAESKVKVFSSQNTVFVQNLSNFAGECMIYDIAGHFILKMPFSGNGVTAINTNLRPGAYVALAISGLEKVSKRLIFQ